MAWTVQDREVIKRAIAAGEMTVRFSDGKTITYRSIEELLKALAAINAELAEEGSAPGADWPGNRRIARYRSGIH